MMSEYPLAQNLNMVIQGEERVEKNSLSGPFNLLRGEDLTILFWS